MSLTLATELTRRRPSIPLLLSATTPAGVGLLSRRLASASLPWRPFPLDLPSAVRRFFDAERPRLLVLVETELWPAVLNEARRRGVPVLLANARLSERSAARYRRASALFSGPLSALTRVLARTDVDAARFVEIGVPAARVVASGDMKFDHAVLMAPHQAGDLAWKAGAIGTNAEGKPSGWAMVDPLMLTLKNDPDVYVIGDAVGMVSPQFLFYPKAGHVANAHGRIVAGYIAERLAGRAPKPALPDNLCYMLVNGEPRESVAVQFD
ncbi:MAG TPA: glycosyltransferase N-terminal domain-containing protein, partial [Thermoanaerobaculia bacterium]|nr:glycosyltransferase N-terminal domain-containing protein [Thermoanaerobaculia bacterium]